MKRAATSVMDEASTSIIDDAADGGSPPTGVIPERDHFPRMRHCFLLIFRWSLLIARQCALFGPHSHC